MKRLDGQGAIVTGASRGIGHAVAKELAEWGAAVVVNYFQSQEPAEELAGEIVSNGGRAIAVRAGVGHPDDGQALVQRTIAEFGQDDLVDRALDQRLDVVEFGQVDILVNNAGVNRDR